MIPTLVPARESTAEAICTWAVNWAIDAVLAWKLVELAAILKVLGYACTIVSGWRSVTEQLNTKDAADPATSTHTSCPFATGADLQIVGYNKQTAPVEVRSAFGAAAESVGLRWGGRFAVPDWNHVDLGPRTR